MKTVLKQSDIDVIIRCESHTDEVIAALGEAVGRAAKAIGMQAENYAKQNETRVDTGRLRNSICTISRIGNINRHSAIAFFEKRRRRAYRRI